MFLIQEKPRRHLFPLMFCFMINSIALDVYESYQALVKKIPAKRKKKSSPLTSVVI